MSEEKDIEWLLKNGFGKRGDAEVYDWQASPAVRLSVHRNDIGNDRTGPWMCDASVRGMFGFIPAYGNTAEAAVNKEALNVCMACMTLCEAVGTFLGKAESRAKAIIEEMAGYRREMDGYRANIKALSPLLGKDVFLALEGGPEFVGSRKALEEADRRLHMEPKGEGVKPFVTETEVHDGFIRLKAEPEEDTGSQGVLMAFSAREELEVHEPGLYPTVDRRDNGRNVYDIWREGYAATGEYSPGGLVASDVRGDDFIDAVEKWYRRLPDKEKYGDLRIWTDKNGKRRASLWGCELFDNEAEARKFFG